MTKNTTQIDSLQLADDWRNLQGPLNIRMTNDYLFRALLQRNEIVLKALICSLLHFEMSKVSSVEIMNPIELGTAITDKEFILDIKVKLNENTIINLEMQAINEGNWLERSLCYLCREFDNLSRGEDYGAVRPVIHIGILDFTLFEESPEFYATYWLMNEKNHRKYSDKLRLSVLDLNCIKQATEEDRKYKIDYWAGLFKSTTWEEIKMYAESDEYLREAVDTVYKLTQDEKIRQQCEAREDYYRRTAGRERMLREAQEQLIQKSASLEHGIRMLIRSDKTSGKSHAEVTAKLQEWFDLSPEEAEIYMKKYWNEA